MGGPVHLVLLFCSSRPLGRTGSLRSRTRCTLFLRASLVASAQEIAKIDIPICCCPFILDLFIHIRLLPLLGLGNQQLGSRLGAKPRSSSGSAWATGNAMPQFLHCGPGAKSLTANSGPLSSTKITAPQWLLCCLLVHQSRPVQRDLGREQDAISSYLGSRLRLTIELISWELQTASLWQ